MVLVLVFSRHLNLNPCDPPSARLRTRPLPCGSCCARLATLAFASPLPQGSQAQQRQSNLQKNFYTDEPSLATDFSTALMLSGYMYVVGALQVLGGLMVLVGRYVALGLTLLGPVIVNILLFHIFLAPAGLAMAVVVGALALFLLYSYRANFAGLVKR